MADADPKAFLPDAKRRTQRPAGILDAQAQAALDLHEEKYGAVSHAMRIERVKEQIRQQLETRARAAKELDNLKHGMRIVTEKAAERLRSAELSWAEWQTEVEAWIEKATAAIATDDVDVWEALWNTEEPDAHYVNGFITIALGDGGKLFQLLDLVDVIA